MLVTGGYLARYLGLSPGCITQLKREKKIRYKSKQRRLYDLEQSIMDYDKNTDPGHALRHQAEKNGFYR